MNFNNLNKPLRHIANHRVDSVIESSLREIIGSKNFALIKKICETTIYENKVFHENLVFRNIAHYLEILYNFRNCTFNFLIFPI